MLRTLLWSTLALGIGLGAPAFAVTDEQRTDPRVRPKEGKRHTAFAVKFTLRQTPGHEGVYDTSYRVEVTAPADARAGCTPPPLDPVREGEAGERVRVKLRAPEGGWCRRRHRVTVFLDRGPYCPADATDPCPAFPSESIETGHARFRVRPASKG